METQVINPATVSAPLFSLSASELAHRAPSIYGRVPHEARSEKYKLFGTPEIIDMLAEQDIVPTYAVGGKSLTSSHMVRFAHKKDLGMGLANVGDERPELVLVNSHNGSTCYELSAGIFRKVCSNGLIVCTQSVGMARIKHMGHTIEEVIATSRDIMTKFDGVMEDIREMKSIHLQPYQVKEFVRQAAIIRYGEEAYRKGRILTPDNLLTTRRNEDNEGNLWSVFNIVQENMMKGGVRIGQRNMRPIRNVNAIVGFNSDLWKLAESYRQERATA